jgi:hypothetical protein
MKPFYEMPHKEAVEYLRTLYLAQPKADWDKLAVGNIIVSKGRGWRITHIPPKRGFVMATNVMTGEVEKLLRSQYAKSLRDRCSENTTPDLLVTDEATLAILRTVHQEEIEKAIAKGIKISPNVQYDYPELFTPFPASWDDKRREKADNMWRRINEMRAFNDLREPPGWQLRKVDDWEAQTVKDIENYKKYRAEVEAGVGIKKQEAIPEIVARVNDTISEMKDEIEILSHLRKHLEKTL